MNFKISLALVIIAAVALGIYFIHQKYPDNNSQTIESLVTEYGRQYAPGRVEIKSVETMGDIYRVEAEIVEVSSHAGAPEEVARRPVTLTVAKTEGELKIIDVKLGVYPGDGNWIYSPVSAQGIQFLYPETLLTKYISAVEWPPEVKTSAGELLCDKSNERMIGNRKYCVKETREGAAGSTYVTYDFMTAQGERLANIKFTLRFPQCLNYDKPEQNDCVSEQNSFDILGLVDRIASSIRIQ